METTTNKAKKITKSTIKSFIKKYEGKILIKIGSQFDGMTDGVETVKDEFKLAKKAESNLDYNLGIAGAWFVGQSRDYFTAWETEELKGYHVSNSCGSFDIAIKKSDEVVKDTTAPVTEIKEGDQLLADRPNSLFVGRVKEIRDKAVKVDYAIEPIFASGSAAVTVYTWSCWIPKSCLFIAKAGTAMECISVKGWFLEKVRAYGIKPYMLNKEGKEVLV